MNYQEYKGTCSIDNPKEGCLCYCLDPSRLPEKFEGRLSVIMPKELESGFAGERDKIELIFSDDELESVFADERDKIELIFSDDPLFDFVMIHNAINRHREATINEIGYHCSFSEHCSIGNEGMRYIKTDTGEVISVEHMGNVVIGDNVTIGVFSSIARAVFDSTVIGNNVKIGSGCQIGHNCQIGDRTIVIDGTVVLGSAKIGADCYIGGNSVIRNGVKVADGNLIGMGSVVTKDILYEGAFYYGNPARYKGIWDGVWP